MKGRVLRHKSLVLCEILAKQWRKNGEKDAHVVKDAHGFYFVTFGKGVRGRFYF